MLWAGISAALITVALACAVLWFRARMSASLPHLDGEIPLAGLAAPVRVDTDSLGIPTIHASSRVDVARAHPGLPACPGCGAPAEMLVRARGGVACVCCAP